MSSNKDFRKSLKGPDQFQTSVASWMDKAYAYRVQIGTAVALILVVVVGVLGWQYSQGQKKAQRQQELAKIETMYSDELKEASEKRGKLQDELKKINDKGEKKLTKKDRSAKALLESQIADVKANHDKSVAQYKEFFENNRDYPEGWLAGFRVASDYLKKKNFVEAKSILVDVMAKANGVLFYELQGRFLLANVLAELKEYDQALSEIETLISKANDDLKPRMILLKGRVLVAKKDMKAARESLDLLIKDHSASVEAQKARAMKAVLIR